MMTTSLLESRKMGKSCAFLLSFPLYEVSQHRDMMRTEVGWNSRYSRPSASVGFSRDATRIKVWDCLLHGHSQAALFFSCHSLENVFSLKHFVWRMLEQSNTVAFKARMWNYMALYQIWKAASGVRQSKEQASIMQPVTYLGKTSQTI
jgi:hypothetical protein